MNVGVVRHGTQSSTQLLEKAKFIIKHTIQKKIFLRPKDEMGVILMGSDCGGSDSVMGLDNVKELCRMQCGNWNLVKSIEKLQTTDQSCSWMEGIFAAIEYIKKECVDHSERQIILLSDFNEEEDIASQFQPADIVEALRSEDISLIAIGERALDSINKDSYTASEALLTNVLQEMNGQYLTYDLTKSDVRYYKQVSTKPALWHCEMELGEYFRIPIIGIAKTPSEVKLPRMTQIAKTSTSDDPDQQVPIKNVAQWTDSNRTIHKEEEIIRGYVYGGKAIPVSEEAKKAMTPNINEKCYKVHGFTARKNIPMEYWLSDGTYVIVPANESASRPFYDLVQAMAETDMIAIVEKVYKLKNEANMMALFPNMDEDEPWSLVEIGLPFERDYGAIGQKPLNFVMKQLSREQSDAMDDLLVSLELPDGTDEAGNDRYLPECMPDPGAQHMWDMLSARALNPDKPLPSIDEEIKNLLEPPEYLRERCKPVAEKIKDLFSLEKVEPLRSRKRARGARNDQTDKDNATRSVKDEEEDVRIDNTDDSKNNPSSSAAFDFDFDDLAD